MNIGQSETKSRFSFDMPDTGQRNDSKVTVFRDPAAVPMLREIATALKTEGYDVTHPKPGKACHAACSVRFPHLVIGLVLLVQRSEGKVIFELLTWPHRSLRQRMLHGRLRSSGDCDEWSGVCSTVNAILVRDKRLGSVAAMTFAEGENEARQVI
jgi:hypothetical protein